MAELKASELKYGAPLKISVGGYFLTATQIETPTGAEYAPEGALYLNLAKLGLPDETPGGNGPAGVETTESEVATTTSLPLYAWSTPLVTAKDAAEAAKLVGVCFPTAITKTAGSKLCLRIYGMGSAAEIGKPMLEPKTSTKAAVSLCVCTVYCIGR